MVTAKEVYQAVLAELKHYNTTSMTPEEFNYHIWRAELTYVKNRYWAHEQHQKSIDDLDVIKVVTDGVAGAPSRLPNEGPNVAGQEYVTRPTDYLYLLAVGVIAKIYGDPCIVDGTLSELTAAMHLKDDKRYVINDDYYSKPSYEWPTIYYEQRGNKFTFKAGASIIQEVEIAYFRNPIRIVFDPSGQASVDSEFSWPQVLEIVKLCVEDYLEIIRDPRTQSQIAVNDRNFNQFPPNNVRT